MRYWMWGVRTGKVRGHMTLGLDTDGSGSGSGFRHDVALSSVASFAPLWDWVWSEGKYIIKQ